MNFESNSATASIWQSSETPPTILTSPNPSSVRGATDYSPVELGDTTEDCLGKLGGALDGSLAHLLDLVASMCAFWARFLCQLLLSEAKGVASEDSIVHMSIDCQAHCSSSIAFFKSQANSKIPIKSVIVSSGEIIAEIHGAIFCINRWRAYCLLQHAITGAEEAF